MDKLLIPPSAAEMLEGDQVAHIPPPIYAARIMHRPPARYKLPWAWKYRPDFVRLFCEEIAKGRALSRIVIEEVWCPSISTVKRWLKANPEFAAEYDAALLLAGERIAYEILDIAYSRIPVDDKRQIIDAHKWLAGRLNRTYADRKLVEQTVDANVNVNTAQQIDVSGMTMEELKALESAFNKIIDLQPAPQEEGE